MRPLPFPLPLSILAASLLFLGTSSPASAAVSQAALDLLQKAETCRGVLPGTGLQWKVEAKSESLLSSKDATLLVRTQAGSSLAEVIAPASSKGKKYLLADGTMYFYRPGTSRPVNVPQRQQVAGDAAIGDIASTSFLAEYHPVSVTPNALDGERCALFQLNAKTGTTPSYSHIKLWVSESERLIRKAEFYTRTGRHIRTALFDYDSTLDYEGESIPFLSQLQVVQLLGTPKTTTLFFSDYKLASFPAALFHKDALANNS